MKRFLIFLGLFVSVVFTACNQSQPSPIFRPQFSLPTSVFINEIHYDNASTDTGEAIEIAAPAGTDLTGWQIVLYNGSSTQLNVYGTYPLSGVISDAGQGFGFIVFPITGIQNGDPDGIALVNPANIVIQFLSYGGSFTAIDGFASGLTSTDIGVKESPSTPVGNSLQLTGTGTTYSDFSWASASPNTFGAVNTGQSFGTQPPVSATVLINEVDADQDGTDAAEFVELYDGGVGNTPLADYVLVFFNGSGDIAYEAFNLDGFSTSADGYFVLCGDAANVANCDLDVSPNTNLIQNGADAVALYKGDASSFPDGTAVTTTDLSDALVYDTSDADDAGLLVLLNAGQAQIDENGNGNGTSESMQRCPDGEGGALNTSGYTLATPTPGTANCPTPPGPELKKIHEIQGSGLLSPFDGMAVTIEAVVTADFQRNASADNGDLGGFYVQEESADEDGDPLTSEGLFVFDGSNPAVEVQVGDVVRVTGTVDEFGSSGSNLTELTGVTVEVIGTAVLPAPVSVNLPVSALADFEKYEGMLVVLPQELVISEYFNYDRFGEMVLALPLDSLDRPFQPTSYVDPSAAQSIADQIALRKITLDDGQSAQNPDYVRHPNGAAFTLGNRFRGGDTVTNTIGVMDDSFGLYRIQPTGGATYTPTNPRPLQPDTVGGDVRVVSANVLNYFLTLDNGTNDICGPLQNQECRGADDANEFDRQRTKILAALSTLDADVYGLIELENTPGVEPLADLVNGLNSLTSAGTYSYIDTGIIGTDAIKVGIIYKPAMVSPQGSFAVLDDVSFTDPNNTGQAKNRPALAQTFTTSSGAAFTVVVNHLKSKGSGCGAGDDDPLQGNCNGTRTAAAQVLLDWLATDPTASNDADFLIVGDLNAYDEEDPIQVFLDGGFSDLNEDFQGEYAYSYLFDGQFGYLDYALASTSLRAQVTGATEWHINADEPDLLDYDTSFKSTTQDALYETNPFRASDHDPILVGLDLNAPPRCDSASASTKVLWPANHQMVNISVLGVTDPDGDAFTISIDSIFQDEPVSGLGSGDTSPDGAGIGSSTAQVRAERAGNANGRYYHIGFTATDSFNSSCSGEILVSVPKSQGKKGAAVDDGALFDSTLP
ncbi:MAG: ExeM/NucH family extracellular endonuclease [Trueperaceae bacterium]|nr:ExeM/NucH family extracellular endonuclease [Trueperaceae bacterium]